MSAELVPYNLHEKNVVIYRTEDNTLQLDVQLAAETVWLNVQQLALLFGRDRTVISRHIRNIYKEKELNENITCAKFAHMGTDGDQTYETTYYNLDVIISIGYRVKSQRGVEFRQWANKVIKSYLINGFAVNQQLLAMQRQIDSRFLQQDQRMTLMENALQEHKTKIDFFVRTSLPPIEQIFFDGQFFEARALLERLIKMATKRVIVVDAYVDATTFEILDVRNSSVSADIYSNGLHATLRDTHNAQAGIVPINTHKWSHASHDRWLVIDDQLYHCGHSIKDMGKKLSAITFMETPADTVLQQII